MENKDFDILSTNPMTDAEYEKAMSPSNGDKCIDDVMKSADELSDSFYDFSDLQDLDD